MPDSPEPRAAPEDSPGALVRRYRELAGLSQEALAERAGLSARTLSSLERGAHGALLETLRRLAEALDLSADQRTALMHAARAGKTPPVDAAGSGAVVPDEGHGGAARAAAPDGAVGHDDVAGLPVALTPLIGREREEARLAHLLRGERVRLLTLVGLGGVGKTRLALQVAAGLADAFPGGVYFVALAPLADPAQVPGAVAAALGLREEPGRPLLTTLSAHLRARQVLLLLDNCEHQLAACAELVGALLRACAALQVLATSREGLGLAGEARYRVPSLSVPDPRHLPPVQLAASYEAVRLFVARAQDRLPDFTLSAEHAAAVAEICARLDGIPLAIELAAAWVGTLPVPAIAARLDDRFRLLSRGARGVPPRQQTLRAALDWSWNLLEQTERTALCGLATFPAGCTLPAAQVVLDAGATADPWAVLKAINALVEKSLVLAEEAEGEGRYRLLETVRQYAVERLAEAGEQAAAMDRQAAWCLSLAEEAELRLSGADQGRWLARLEAEHDNLRAALAWALRGDDLTLGFRLAGHLCPFWRRHSHLSEGRRWLERLLQADATRAVAPALRATVLIGAAWLATYQSDFARVDALAEEEPDLFRSLGQRSLVAEMLGHRGMVAWAQGRCAQAVVLLGESLALYRALGDPAGVASTLFRLGVAVRQGGDYARASALYEECLALCRTRADRGGAAVALLGLGDVARDRGDAGAVAAYCGESLSACRELGRSWAVGFSLNNLALAAIMGGDRMRARALAEEALALFRALGNGSAASEVLLTLGTIACDEGHVRRARELILESLALGWPAGPHWLATDGLEALARVAVGSQQAETAVRLSAAASAWRRAMGVPLPPYRRTAYDAGLARARRLLDADAFEWAWQEGERLELDQAVARARSCA